MFNKKFITINNQQVNNLYDLHLWLTIESLQSRISNYICFAIIQIILYATKRILSLDALPYPYYTRVY